MTEFALKILVVEDNDALREATLAFLQKHGHCVRGVAMAEEIQEVAGGFVPDVFVVDLNLPDEDGLSLVRRLRRVLPNVGIVITTARSQIGDKVAGYESGADLYLPKPVAPIELLAGINQLAKRVKQSSLHNNLRFDQARMLLFGPDGSTELTGGEGKLLIAFSLSPGLMLERWQVAEVVGSADVLLSAASVEMRITRLRRKLALAGGPPPYIKALHKQGYTLCSAVTLD